MSDAPEAMPDTIAAWYFHASKRDEWLEGGWSLDHDRKTTSYTRTDLADARVAAAEKRGMEKAIGLVASYEGEVAKWNTNTPPGCHKVCGVVACEALASAIRAEMGGE